MSTINPGTDESWECLYCGNINSNKDNRCPNCYAPRCKEDRSTHADAVIENVTSTEIEDSKEQTNLAKNDIQAAEGENIVQFETLMCYEHASTLFIILVVVAFLSVVLWGLKMMCEVPAPAVSSWHVI